MATGLQGFCLRWSEPVNRSLERSRVDRAFVFFWSVSVGRSASRANIKVEHRSGVMKIGS